MQLELSFIPFKRQLTQTLQVRQATFWTVVLHPAQAAHPGRVCIVSRSPLQRDIGLVSLHKNRRDQLFSLLKGCRRALHDLLEPSMIWEAFMTGNLEGNALAYMDLVPFYLEPPRFRGREFNSPETILAFKSALESRMGVISR